MLSHVCGTVVSVSQAILHFGSLAAMPEGMAASMGLLLQPPPKPKGKVGRPPGKRKASIEATAVSCV